MGMPITEDVKEEVLRRIMETTEHDLESIKNALKHDEYNITLIYTHFLKRLKDLKEFAIHNNLGDYDQEEESFNFDMFWDELHFLIEDLLILDKLYLKKEDHKEKILRLARNTRNDWSRLQTTFSDISKFRRFLHHANEKKDRNSKAMTINELNDFFHPESDIKKLLEEHGFTIPKNFDSYDHLYRSYYGIYQNLIKQLHKDVADMIERIIKYIRKYVLPTLGELKDHIEGMIKELEEAA